jgi:putative salt-induced outer membrane protein YdiY
LIAMSLLLALATPALAGLLPGPADTSGAMPPIPEPLLAATPYGAPLPAGYLATVLQDEPEEPQGSLENWQGSLQFGAAVSTGNAKSTNIDANLLAVKENKVGESVKDRWTLDAFYSFAEGDVDTGGGVFESRTTREIYGGGVKYDFYLSERTYLLGRVSYLVDRIAGVDSRFTVGAGIGRNFIVEDDLQYSAEAGVSYFAEDLEGLPSDDYIAARLAHVLDWQIASDLTLHHDAEVFPSLEDSDDIFAKARTSLNYAMSANLTAGLSWLLLYDNTPVPGNERVDNVIALNVGWLL